MLNYTPRTSGFSTMELLYQTHSPYARKTLVFAREVGLHDRVRATHQETSPLNTNEIVYAENPLGQVPVLLRPGMTPIFDSDVICAYLDTLHTGTPLIPTTGERRWTALRLQSVAKSLCDFGIAIRWENTRRPASLRYPPLAVGFEGKLLRTYDWLERELDVNEPLHIGHIALATALSWLLFRSMPDFRKGRPRLTAWFEEFSLRPSMQGTQYCGNTDDHT